MANELETFGDIKEAAIARVKGDATDVKTVAFFEESINTRYRTICSRKKWKFLRQTNRSLLLPAKYETGTISITAGSRKITGAGTGWTSDQVGWWIKPQGSDNSYRVIVVESATAVRVDSPIIETTAAGQGYTMYQAELALFPDLEDVDDVRIDGKPWRVRPVGPAEINENRQKMPSREGPPVKYSIEGKAFFPGVLMKDFVMGYDFLGQGTVKKAISFFPHIPDQDYTIHIPYKIKVSTLNNDLDEPLIPIEHRHILLYFTLADWYMKDRQDQTGRYYESLAKDELRELEDKYLDTDDILEFRAPDPAQYSHSYLLRHSKTYFDREG